MALPKQEGKKLFQLVCGNVIAEIEEKKKNVAMALLKQDEKKKKFCCNWFVVMALPKQRRDIKKKYAYSYSFSTFFD